PGCRVVRAARHPSSVRANLPGMLTSQYTPAGRVSLALVLAPLRQGAGDPTCRRDAMGWWLAIGTPSGAASLRLREVSGGVEATAWGPGAEHALAGVPQLLGARDDPSGFDPTRHPVVAALHRRFP